MDEKILVLHSSIRHDLEVIAGIYEALDCHPLETESDQDTLIVIAYHLHNLYNAFENILQNIAGAFENAIDDSERWHSRLLERMRLDLMPVRPAVIDDRTYDALDELRRFRHLFRHAYSINLDPMRLQLVLHKAQALREAYPEQMERFLGFLQRLI